MFDIKICILVLRNMTTRLTRLQYLRYIRMDATSSSIASHT